MTWQPIESAPKDGTAVWLLVDGQLCIGYCQPADGVLRRTDMWFVKVSIRRRSRDRRQLPDEVWGCNGVDEHPTRWQAFPDPPVTP